MEQAFNLILAFLLKKGFGVGRDSAVRQMRTKVLSCIIVSCGLFLIAYQEQLAKALAEKSSYFAYSKSTFDGEIQIATIQQDRPGNDTSGNLRQLMELVTPSQLRQMQPEALCIRPRGRSRIGVPKQLL